MRAFYSFLLDTSNDVKFRNSVLPQYSLKDSLLIQCPKCGDALQLGDQMQDGSFHSWINRAGSQLCDLSLTRAIQSALSVYKLTKRRYANVLSCYSITHVVAFSTSALTPRYHATSPTVVKVSGVHGFWGPTCMRAGAIGHGWRRTQQKAIRHGARSTCR